MRVLVISDFHAPAHSPHVVDWLADLKRKYKPQNVVCIGDLGDQHAWSTHSDDPHSLGPDEEDIYTLRVLKQLYRLFPRVKACIGNHDLRLARRCGGIGIPSRLQRTVSEIYSSPAGWQWRDSWYVDGVWYSHGTQFRGPNPALQAALLNGVPAVIGHHHSRAGVTYLAGSVKSTWGMSVGCLVDPTYPTMAYAARHASQSILGTGVVIDRIPHFIPMV